MVHLRGLVPAAEQLAKLNLTPPNLDLSESERTEIGNMDERAGFDETSRLMFLRPDLVDPVYRRLEPRTTNTPAEFFELARADNWLGYLRLARSRPPPAMARASSDTDPLGTMLSLSPSLTTSWTSESSRATQIS